MLFSSPGLLHVPGSSPKKGQQRGYDAEQSMVKEMEMRQCRGLAREEGITERVQDQPTGGGAGRTSRAPKLLCGNTERRRAERRSMLNNLAQFRGQERQKTQP